MSAEIASIGQESMNVSGVKPTIGQESLLQEGVKTHIRYEDKATPWERAQGIANVVVGDIMLVRFLTTGKYIPNKTIFVPSLDCLK